MNEEIYAWSRYNAWNGEQCVHQSHYQKAVQFYTLAIDLYPYEYRYFLNRSFCWDQLRDFGRALSDALVALNLNASRSKCHFRKARALKGLKRLDEAELCFQKVLQLEGTSCREAIEELINVRILAVIDCGFDHTMAKQVANRSHNIIEAINVLKREVCDTNKSSSKIKRLNKYLDKCVSNSTQNNCHAKEKPVNDCSEDSIRKDGTKEKAMGKSGEKNVLKKINDFILNIKNDLNDNKCNDNKNNDNLESKCDSIKQLSDEKNNKSEPKNRSEDKKSDNSSISGLEVSEESNDRTTSNQRRYNRHNDNTNDTVFWDDSRRNTSFSPQYNRSFIGLNRRTEPTNLWKFKGLCVSNIIPNEHTKRLLRDILSKFGNVSSLQLIPQTQSAIIHFDNPESPRIAMARLQGLHIPTICYVNDRLSIKFRPLDESKNYPSISHPTDRQPCDEYFLWKTSGECYFWRTTGCNHMKFCKLKHIPINKGVDLQPWMQSVKVRNKRYNRRPFDD